MVHMDRFQFTDEQKKYILTMGKVPPTYTCANG